MSSMSVTSAGSLWFLIAVVAAATIAIKALGPVVLGGRSLPPALAAVLALMPPVLLAALVATSALAEGDALQVDASTVGVAVAGVLLWQRRHLLLAVLVAAAVTAALRAAGLP